MFDLSTTHWCVVHRCLNPGDATSVFVEDSQGTALECLFAKAAPANQYMLYLMYLYFNFVFAFAVGIQQAAVAGSVCKIWPALAIRVRPIRLQFVILHKSVESLGKAFFCSRAGEL